MSKPQIGDLVEVIGTHHAGFDFNAQLLGSTYRIASRSIEGWLGFETFRGNLITVDDSCFGCRVGDSVHFPAPCLKVVESSRRVELVVSFKDGINIKQETERFKLHHIDLISSYEGFRLQKQYIFRANSISADLLNFLTHHQNIKQFTWCWL